MSFFFALNLDSFNNLITIPKFTNEGMKLKKLSLYSAKINRNKWLIRRQNYKEDEDFFYLEVLDQDLDDIFFLNKSNFCLKEQELLVHELKTFYDFKSNYSFRANLRIKSKEHGFSSYQSEYPVEMTNKEGSILSTISSLINEENTNFLVFRQIYYLPIKKPFNIFLVDLKKEEILSKAIFHTNSSNVLNISKIKNLKNCCFYSDGFLGIPIFISYGNKNGISMEHSHPPHLYLQSNNKFKMVTNLKNKVKKIVSK